MKEKWELAYEDYLNGMKYKDIANKYEVSISAVKSWKSRYWKAKKVATKKSKVATKKVAKKAAKKIIEESNEELDEERQLFCIYYLKYHNQVKAYMKVHPKVKYESACVMASRLMKEEAIRNEIKRLKEELYVEALLDPHDIIQKYIDIAFADEEEIDGKILKMSDCIKALEFLSKYLEIMTPEQKARIELMKAQTSKVTGNDESEEIEEDGFVEALNETAKEDWSDYDE